ncbi:uncharacterized protein E0L32_007865 [Thyridium curvatum]|uniref:Zn(2)-C6 fungal-type domain-containing protein n=1 Tax=Thyridium curvatum TaxID=1093900 RepID=A0A507AXH0_9PEZI|nr:uncharacterized protein E0L32_007865 [Thyridium curvatum]TPX11446.1 hypothetical protein E0L32_007865 [Thyridium curvatum]
MPSTPTRDTGLGLQGQGPTQTPGQGTRSSLSAEQRHAQKARFRATSYPRRRAVTACESCRVRKTKCDNERPRCSACIKNDVSCSYDPRLDHSSFDPASLLILEKLNEVSLKLDNIGSTAAGAQVPRAAQPLVWDVGAIGDSLGADQVADQLAEPVQVVDELCSIDSLEVSAVFASTDHLLTWPIFAGQWPKDLLSQELLAGSFQSSQPATEESTPSVQQHQKPGIREEDAPQLVDRFLHFVYPKNPILYTRQIREYARRIAEDGFGWDAPSCLVLLACALGAIALPFDPIDEEGKLHGRYSVDEVATRHRTAEAYFQAARKRLGLLEIGLAASQCHMLCCIFLFYTMRPIQAWSATHQAASTLALHLQAQAALEKRGDRTQQMTDLSEKRLEQRLYWTVLKSECEVRTELDFPQSDLCKLNYPYLFPSPPTPSPPSPVQSPQGPTPASIATPSTQATSTMSSSSYQKVEEQSWFYYLSEIALRRIQNRVLNAFYKQDHESWARMGVERMASIASGIEDQLAIWYSSLPESIRFDNLGPDQQFDELRLVTQGRCQTIKELLYRPFLYLAIHSPEASNDTSTGATLASFVEKALDICNQFHTGLSITHRHHGTWYGLRVSAATGLILVAANMRGLITWTSTLDNGEVQENRYGRAIRICIEKLRYWEAESPDIMRAREILEHLLFNGAG